MKTKLYKIESLVFADYNPRKLSDTQREQVRTSLQKFGFVQPLVVNTHPERKNVIVGGWVRATVAKEDLQWVNAPCFEVNLTLEQERELNIRLNKNHGEWDWEKLDSFFTPDELMEFGFEAFNFGLHNDTIPLPAAGNQPQKQTSHVEFDALLNDREERVVFECYMLPADRKTLTSVLNSIKESCSFTKTDEALMHLVTLYKENQ
ncbi:MAG: ParB N-terminal domain-containing protein [Candidatus Kapabacteria bacterium]|nr:ParB N-terminal domain-containing protein [Candidatus Kapabacteria bacterium]